MSLLAICRDMEGKRVEKIHNESFDSYVNYVKKLLDVGLGDGLPLFVSRMGLVQPLLCVCCKLKKSNVRVSSSVHHGYILMHSASKTFECADEINIRP